MSRFLRPERLLDLFVILLAVPTVITTALLATEAPYAHGAPQKQLAADGACATAASPTCFANPERRERSMARARMHDVQRAWRAAESRLAGAGEARLQHREPRWRLALERCDSSAADCTTNLQAE